MTLSADLTPSVQFSNGKIGFVDFLPLVNRLVPIIGEKIEKRAMAVDWKVIEHLKGGVNNVFYLDLYNYDNIYIYEQCMCVCVCIELAGDKLASNYYNSPSAFSQLPVVYCVCCMLLLLCDTSINLNDVKCWLHIQCHNAQLRYKCSNFLKGFCHFFFIDRVHINLNFNTLVIFDYELDLSSYTNT